MRNVLVTGPTGCLGSNLVSRLLAEGLDVRVYARPGWKSRQGEFLPRGGEAAYGDIRDQASLARAMEGRDTVFHTAAVVSFRNQEREEQLSVNVGGTRAVVAACLEAGVGRLVHTSSVAALGHRDDGALVDESAPFNWPASLTYRQSKHLAEREVRDGIARGLDAVIVNPSVIVGPGDRYVHGGQLVRDAARGRLVAYPGGGMNIVGVDDVVSGHLAAARRGRSGERYILGGTNLTHREAFQYVARLFGVRGPKLRMPRAAVLGVARAAEAVGTLTRTRPLITPDLVAGVGKYQWFSIAKARRELAYNPVSLEKSLLDAYIWYRDHGMI